MERETESLQTRLGKAFVINKWLTARESRSIKEVMLKHVKFSMDQTATRGGLKQTPTMKEYDASSAIKESEELSVSLIVISYDGSSENILDRILDSREEDWFDILEATKKVTDNLTEPKSQIAGDATSEAQASV